MFTAISIIIQIISNYLSSILTTCESKIKKQWLFKLSISLDDIFVYDILSSCFRVHHPVYRGGSAPLRGEGDKEFVVWSGSLTIKGLYACNVEMTSAAAFVKPAAL